MNNIVNAHENIVKSLSLSFLWKSVLVISAMTLICTSSQAQELKPPHESWTFTFHFENDLFADTDRFYTNGIKLSWVSPELQWFQDLAWMQKPGLIQATTNKLIELLPFSDDATRQRNLAFSFGQKMYTPEDISRRDLITDDRPYAGWLYGSAAFHSKTYRRLDTFEIQMGFAGDFSIAEETQDFVHSIRGIDKANGWDNQIDTEVGFALIYDRKQRLIPRYDFHKQWGMDFIAHAGVAAGTVFSHVSAGVEFRIGWNIPTDFGTALIRPAGDTNAPADTKDPRYSRDKQAFSFHLFGGTSGRMVFRDIFLDGNTFSDSHSTGKKLLVGDFVVGVSLIYRKFKLSYAQVLRTKEFDRQRSGQNFGSISLSYTY
ncbi:MAG: lipid A deacylase LpxR family protein [Gammaproteobacteria bacterium]|nr:lipid A deacylase LpxR family protein [Gammaproteobacteria bacterium]